METEKHEGADDTFVATIDKAKAALQKGARAGRDSLSTIITVLILACFVIARLLYPVISGENFTASFFIDTALGLALILIVRFIWSVKGRSSGEENADYQRNRQEAGRCVQKVFQDCEINRLNDYCDWANEENRINTLKGLLEDVVVDYGDYLEKYSKMTRKEILAIEKLEPKQKKTLIRLNTRAVRYPKISAIMLTGGLTFTRARHEIDNTEKRETVRAGYLWTAAFLAFAFFANSFATAIRDQLDVLSIIYQSLIWTVSTLISMFVGYNFGLKQVTVYRNAKYLSIVRELQGFEEWKK